MINKRPISSTGGKLPNAERVREQLDSGAAQLERKARPALVSGGGEPPHGSAREWASRLHPGPRTAELYQVEEKIPQLQQQTNYSHKRGLPMNLVNYNVETINRT